MRRLLIVLIVLAVLAVGTDRVAAHVAADRLADRVMTEERLDQSPDVTIRGFPFLTQALSGRYQRLDLRARDVDRGNITVDRIGAQLSGVTLPLRDVLGGGVEQVPVDRVEVHALVSYDELSAASGDRGLRFGSAPGGGVQVTGRLAALGQSVRATARVDVEVDGDTLSLLPRDVRIEGAPAGIGTAFAADALAVRVEVPELPFGARLRNVSVDPDGVTVSASADDVVLGSAN